MAAIRSNGPRPKKSPNCPRLRDVLLRYRDSFLDIELKVKGLERTIVDLFLRLKPRKGCVVSSFLPGALKSLHAEDPTIPLGLICETKTQLRSWSELPVNYVVPHHELLDVELIRKVKGAGKKIIVWTVNDAAAMQQFAEWGVDGIISDDTETAGPNPGRLKGNVRDCSSICDCALADSPTDVIPQERAIAPREISQTQNFGCNDRGALALQEAARFPAAADGPSPGSE